MLPCDTFRPRGGKYLGSCSKGCYSALRVSVAHSSSILIQDGRKNTRRECHKTGFVESYTPFTLQLTSFVYTGVIVLAVWPVAFD